MAKAFVCLKDLAKEIGWKLVTDDKGFSMYEYDVVISKYEKLSYVVRILEEPTEFETYEILSTLIKVLPGKLKRKLKKLVSKFKIKDLENMIEVSIFTIQEYKNATDYAKLKEYGKILGVDLEQKGFMFEYKLTKNKKAEIMSIVELNLPMELAPILGKIKKIDYKIAYVKNIRFDNQENE